MKSVRTRASWPVLKQWFFLAVSAAAAAIAGCGGGGMSSYAPAAMAGAGGAVGTGGGGGYGATPPPMMAPPPPPPPAPQASAYSASVLVSDGAVSSAATDPNLKNPWGIVFAPNAPVWIANNATQTSTLYDGTGIIQPLVVAIPAGTNGPADPTGIVFNGSSDFVIASGTASGPAKFLFAGESGTISGWAPSVDPKNAVLAYDDGAGGAVYKGLAIATDANGANHLYATDFHNNKIDVFDAAFHKVAPSGAFTDPSLPHGYAPFGIQAITVQNQTLIYVSYAQQQGPDNRDDASGPGLGLVDVFDTAGALKTHLIAPGGKLNAPWGMALAPANFGTLSNALLVGNFGDGTINGFDPSSGAFIGTVSDANGQPITNPGLWGIAFGNGSNNQPATTLYFSAGIANEADGAYGRIDLGATPPDIAAPTIALTSPADGATVSGSVTLTASASDNVGVTGVKFFAGTTAIGTATAAPYSVAWDTTQAANGSVTLTAQAQDAAGNVRTSAAVTVTVSNTTVTFTQLQTNIFTPICSVCHTGVGTTLPGAMNLTAGHAYASLVNVASLEQPSLKRVAPGDPTNSYIIHKLEGTPGITGGRMPLGGPYLDQATIDQVKAWIAAGAPNN